MANSMSIQAILGVKDKNWASGFQKAQGQASALGSVLKGGLGFGILTGIGQQAFSALTTGLKGLGASVVSSGSDFDTAMSQVAATSGKTVADMEKDIGSVDLAWGTFTGNLREYALEMGKNTAFSATEAAEALNYMALAGYDTQQSMTMLPNVLNLASAGAMDLARASDMVTDTQTAFGMGAERTTQMVDEMAKAASTGNTSVEQLGDAFLVVGGLAQELNGGMVDLKNGSQASVDGIQELEIALTAMANAGIKGGEAGTHMRNMLLKLSSPTTEGTKALEKMGVSVFDTEGKMRSLSDIFEDLNKEMGEMSQQAKLNTISELFNTRDTAAAEALLNAVSQDWDSIGESILGASEQSVLYRGKLYSMADAQAQFGDAIYDSSKGFKVLGAAESMAMTQLDNFEGDVTLMKSAWEGFTISLWDTTKASARGVVSTLTEMIGGATDAISNSDFVDRLAGKIQGSLEWLMTKIPKAIDTVKPYWEVFRDAVTEVGDAFGEAFSAIGDAVGSLDGQSTSIQSFSDVIGVVKNALITLANFIKEHAETFAWIIEHIPQIIAAILGFKAITGVIGVISGFTGAFGGMASAVTGGGGGSSIGQAVIQIAAGVLIMAAAFYVMSAAATMLSESGGGAIATFFGMLGAIAGLIVIVALFSQQLSVASKAVLMIGAGVLLVAAGFAVMTACAIALTNAGGGAIAVFFGMIAALAGLIALVALLGPELAVGAAAVVVLGAGLLLCAAAAVVAAAALLIVSIALPQLVQYGASGATAILLLTAALVAFGAGAAIAGVGFAALTISLAAFAVSATASAAGAALLAAALLGVNSSMKSIAKNAASSEKSLRNMMKAVSVVESGLKAIGSMATTAIGALTKAFKGGEQDVKTAADNMSRNLTTALTKAFAKVPGIAKNGMAKFTSGIKGGGASAVAAASQISASAANALGTGLGVAIMHGRNIGIGFAQGMAASLSQVQSIAGQLAVAANAAIAAKAKIGSPSRVARELGQWEGKGWGLGILDMVSYAKDAAEKLFYLPTLQGPELALGIAGMDTALSEEYSYTNNSHYTIETVLEIDRREFARATADSEREQIARNRRNNRRKEGIR